MRECVDRLILIQLAIFVHKVACCSAVDHTDLLDWKIV